MKEGGHPRPGGWSAQRPGGVKELRTSRKLPAGPRTAFQLSDWGPTPPGPG